MKLQLLFVLVTAFLLLERVESGSTTEDEPFLRFIWSSPAPKYDARGYDDLKGSCLGGDASLLSTGIWLKYNATSTRNAGSGNGMEYEYYADQIEVKYNDSVPSLNYSSSQSSVLTRVEYLIVQPEHGGGKCHCLDVIFNSSDRKAK